MELIYSKSELVNTELHSNARDLKKELEWFESVLMLRSGINAGTTAAHTDILNDAPDLNDSDSRYAKFIRDNSFGVEDRFLLFMSMVAQLKPECLDIFLVQNKNINQIYTEFGGRRGKIFNGFLPTAETFLFVLAGTDLKKRFELLE